MSEDATSDVGAGRSLSTRAYLALITHPDADRDELAHVLGVARAALDAELATMAGQGSITVHGDGTQSRDFTYVGTVCATITDALLRTVTSDEPVNLAFGSRISLLDTLEMLEGILGQPIESNHVENRKGDVPHSQADNALLRSLFPDVTPVSLDDGLRATVAWMQDYLAVASPT